MSGPHDDNNQSGNIQGKFGEHSGNIRGTFEEHSGEHLEKIEGKIEGKIGED
jgi:hypothetical protein